MIIVDIYFLCRDLLLWFSGNDGGFGVQGTAARWCSMIFRYSTEIFKLQDWNKTSEIKGAQKVKNLFLWRIKWFFSSPVMTSLSLLRVHYRNYTFNGEKKKNNSLFWCKRHKAEQCECTGVSDLCCCVVSQREKEKKVDRLSKIIYPHKSEIFL